MNRPNSITTLVQYALENYEEFQENHEFVENVEGNALDCLLGVGNILQEAAMRSGRLDAEPLESLEDETLYHIGNLIEDLAGTAKLCSQRLAKLHFHLKRE